MAALAGAFGFLSRLPVGRSDPARRAFMARPATFPLVGVVLGGGAAVPYGAGRLLGLPHPVLALTYIGSIYALTGIAHVDGLADVGDAVAVHGEEPDRRVVMTDPAVGAGGVLFVTAGLAGLVLGVVALGGLPIRSAVGLLIVAEIGAKLGMATIACLGTPGPPGLGGTMTAGVAPGRILGPIGLALPVAVLTWPSPAAGLALLAGPIVGAVVLVWATRTLGGPTGDVYGAGNEVGRLVALHTGVIVWTLW